MNNLLHTIIGATLLALTLFLVYAVAIDPELIHAINSIND